jgi:hypothetical protein
MRFRVVTIRAVMGGVAFAAVVSWLTVTAWRVSREPGDFLWHAWLRRSTGAITVHGHGEPRTFWPRYWRALLGRPWPGDYPCQCRRAPDLDLMELASAAESGPLLRLAERLSVPHKRAVHHRLTAKSLRRSIAWDEQRLAVLEAKAKKAAEAGRVVHGAAAVSRSFRETIAHNTKLLCYHERLGKKYEEAAHHPWLPFQADPPEPK